MLRFSAPPRDEISDRWIHVPFTSISDTMSSGFASATTQTRGTTSRHRECALWCAAPQRVDLVSASLTCLGKKKPLRGSKSKCVADHRKSVYSPLRSVDADLEPTHDQNVNRYCCYSRGGICVCLTGVGIARLEPD